MKPALLLIDLQNGFLAGELEPARAEIIAAGTYLLNEWRRAGLPVIHIWTTIDPVRDNRMPHWRRYNRWKCLEGSRSHAVPASLQPIEGEAVVHKTFFSGFSTENLEDLLSELQSDTLVVAGVHLHACVRATVLDGYARAFEVIVAEDAVGGYDGLHGAVTRRYLQHRACVFRSTQEILQEITTQSLPDDAKIIHRSPWDAGIQWEWPASSLKEIDAMFLLAKSALAAWDARGYLERGEFLRGLAANIERDAEILANLLVLQIGKPIVLASGEVRRAVELIRSVIATASTPILLRQTGWRRRPLGVVALVTPFNNPLAIPIGKLAPALLYGNTVVWKPAIAGTEIALRIAGLLTELQLPRGVLQVVLGSSATAGECMERADAISLSGSPAAGRVAREIGTRRMIPLQAELGGNNAAIVWRDADMAAAAEEVAEGAFAFAGQRCTATRRVIVDAAIYDEFLSHLIHQLPLFQPGDPMNPATRNGPLISVSSRARLEQLVQRAADAGCRIYRQPSSESSPGSMEPVLVLAIDPTAEIVQEESFGPILVVQRAETWEQALTLCNGVRQGLAAACFTKDAHRIGEFLNRAECGILKINQSTAGAAVDIPFGGWKQSGVGPPEHGPANVEFFSRFQAVYLPAGKLS
jgi:alpha-ketoglutaric semialdehyde dehydrogenase